jgi:hypothetical protein
MILETALYASFALYKYSLRHALHCHPAVRHRGFRIHLPNHPPPRRDPHAEFNPSLRILLEQPLQPGLRRSGIQYARGPGVSK